MDVEWRADLLSSAYNGLQVPTGTPLRVARWLSEYQGVITQAGAQATLGIPFDADGHDVMVIEKGITFTALCEHHLLPFSGYVTIGYLPSDKLIGLSKFARLVHYVCSVPTLQEAATAHIAKAIDEFAQPRGVMVVLHDVVHSCMSMRGVRDKHATTTTSTVLGVFKDTPQIRNEFLMLMR